MFVVRTCTVVSKGACLKPEGAKIYLDFKKKKKFWVKFRDSAAAHYAFSTPKTGRRKKSS